MVGFIFPDCRPVTCACAVCYISFFTEFIENLIIHKKILELVIIEDCCLKCAFHNENAKYGCEMTDEIPVVCSVKMRKMKQEKHEVKNEIQS